MYLYPFTDSINLIHTLSTHLVHSWKALTAQMKLKLLHRKKCLNSRRTLKRYLIFLFPFDMSVFKFINKLNELSTKHICCKN